MKDVTGQGVEPPRARPSPIGLVWAGGRLFVGFYDDMPHSSAAVVVEVGWVESVASASSTVS